MTKRKPGRMSIEQWAALARELRLMHAGREDEARQAVRQHAPAFADQMDAAVADPVNELAFSIMRLIEGDAAQEHHPRAGSPGTDFVLDRVHGLYLRALCGLDDGSTPHCPHVSLGGPVPCVLIPFLNTLDCYRCIGPRMAQVHAALAGREKYTCDICRRHEPGLVMRETLVRLGPVTLALGVCEACDAKTEESAMSP